MKKSKKILVIAIISVLVTAPHLVMAANYNLSFEFTVDLIGVTRSYDAGDINILVNASEELYMYNLGSTDFTIRLYKERFLSDTLIGSISAKRNGTTSESWTNLDSGDYYFRLLKTNDQTIVTGTIDVSQ